MPEKKKDGTYKGRVRIKGFPQKTKSGFSTKNEAKAWELRTAEGLKNPPLDSQTLLFSQVADLWLVNCQKRYKPPTCTWKANVINSALAFWKYDPYMNDLSTLMIETFLNDIGSGKTANRYKRELKNFFNYAITRGLAVENHARKIEPFKEKKYKRYVPPADDIEAAKMFANSFEYDIIILAYNTLARAGEIRRLQWNDVDFEKKEITLWTGKRNADDRKDDTLEMTKTLYKMLLKRSKNKTCNYVFDRNGKKLSQWWVNEIMKRVHKRAKEAGVDFKYFTLHCFRHHVAVLLSYKLSLVEISKILRHRNVTTTDTYLKSLVKIKTVGIKVLDDIQKNTSADVISFQEAINKKGGN